MNKSDDFKRALFPEAIVCFKQRRREYWIDFGVIVVGGLSAFVACGLGLGLALLTMGVVP